jgi:8-oxo-dGTP pyrophosphatase MutT (NUDIX family)
MPWNNTTAFDSYNPFKVYGCIVISQNNKILVVKNRKGSKWSFPKGHKEHYDKTSLDCALRELKEETGITLHRDYITTKKYMNVEYFIYSVPHEYRTFPQDTREIEEARWVNFDELKDMEKNIGISLFHQYVERNILSSPIKKEEKVQESPAPLELL